MEARIDSHPPLESLKAFSLGRMDDASAQVLFLHLEGCPACRRQAEEASGDDFLARLQKARAFSATPAPARNLPGTPKAADHPSSFLPDPARSLAPSIFGASVPPEAPAGHAILSDVPPELIANSQYEVIRELGRGGMGVVYLARNKQMDRLEVLKVVNRTLLDRPNTVERFLREIRSAAALEHKNVVRAYACLQVGKLLALVMEYVEGEDLAHLIDRRGPLSISSACSSIIQAAHGLQEAHTKGMVHRDIKPQNLLLSRKLKEVMILDFGLAKVASEKADEPGLTAAGKMLGTPAYVAPEQILDASKADIRADIYSLGCTLYYLLTGHQPFEVSSLFVLLHAHQFLDAPPLKEYRQDVPPELAAVVSRMMAKDPAQRYQKPAEVAAALAPFVKGARPAPPPLLSKGEKKEPKTPSLPPPLPVIVQVERVPSPMVERAPFDLEDLPAPVPKRPKKGRGKLVALALALLLPLTIGIAMAVFRVETPNGTLVVEMDDDVEAKIKGGKLILTGPDGRVQYILTASDRNKKRDTGEYKIRVEGADGLVLYTQEFKLEKGKKFKVRVTIEPKGKADVPMERKAILDDPWQKQVAALPPQKQVDAVAARMKERNPDFNGKVELRKVERGMVTEISFFNAQHVSDLSPVRPLVGLKVLSCRWAGTLSDLSPLKDMKLTVLQCGGTKVSDLSPLKDMKLTVLYCGATKVSDLSPLKDMKLTELYCDETPVDDLSALKDMKLTVMHCGRTPVSDLSPLKDMKLTELYCGDTKVSDLSPLKDMKLTYLDCGGSLVSDLSPLKGMPLKGLSCDFKYERDAKLLRSITTLKTINGKPASQFWEELELAQGPFEDWLKKVAGLPPAKQVVAVAGRLRVHNPSFTGNVELRKVEGGIVTEIHFWAKNVSDISPVRALVGLKVLACPEGGTLSDLSPLKDMKLTELNCFGTKVSNLSPLKDMKLTVLVCGATKVSDLSPLKHMKLTYLHCGESLVDDLSPLKSMKLTYLYCGRAPVSDLSPLKDMKLTELDCSDTKVSDLSPLKDMKLTVLQCDRTQVSDLSPLKGMPLKILCCDFKSERDAEIIRPITTLERINNQLEKEFWKKVDADAKRKK